METIVVHMVKMERAVNIMKSEVTAEILEVIKSGDKVSNVKGSRDGGLSRDRKDCRELRRKNDRDSKDGREK